MPDPNIATWSISTLTKFIQDVFRNQPPSFFQGLTVEDLAVARKLTVKDQADFLAAGKWHIVGGTGEPALQNSWAHYGSPYAKAAFLKDVSGFVRFTGVIASGTVGSAAFTLPPGMRPATDEIFVVLSNNAVGRLDVNTDGTVVPQSPAVNTWVSLSGVAFKAA